MSVLFVVAACRGRLDELKEMHAQGGYLQDVVWDALAAAAKNNHARVVQWINKTLDPEWGAWVCATAAAAGAGHPALTLKMLKGGPDASDSENDQDDAGDNVDWGYKDENVCAHTWAEALFSAAAEGHLPVCLALASVMPEEQALGVGEALKLACQYDHVDIVKWLMSTFDLYTDDTLSDALVAAAASGAARVMDWAVTSSEFGCERRGPDHGLFVCRRRPSVCVEAEAVLRAAAAAGHVAICDQIVRAFRFTHAE